MKTNAKITRPKPHKAMTPKLCRGDLFKNGVKVEREGRDDSAWYLHVSTRHFDVAKKKLKFHEKIDGKWLPLSNGIRNRCSSFLALPFKLLGTENGRGIAMLLRAGGTYAGLELLVHFKRFAIESTCPLSNQTLSP